MGKVISKQQLSIRCLIFFGLSLLDGIFTYYGVVVLKTFEEMNLIIVLLSKYVGFVGALFLVKILLGGVAILLLYLLFNKQPAVLRTAVNVAIIAFAVLDVVWVFMLLM